MKAMILAAGFGERLRPLTNDTPKPLLKIGTKPLIQYHVERLASAGVRELVINTSWLGDQIESFLGDGSRFGVSISWSRETEPLDTGGGIRRALPLLGSDPFLVINGDIWTNYPLASLVEREWSEEIDAHLVLVPNPEHNLKGDFTLDLQRRVRYPLESDESVTFSGISVMRPDLFALFLSASEKFPIRDVLAGSIKGGYVTGEVFRDTWWDIGTVERLQALNALVSEDVFSENRVSGKEVSPVKKVDS
ncbi:MAG: nucleotidyltransferase family protein [Porticoccus sp.]|nr:nucleotidyltransferase family protein [Porticoccus sp.]MBQ0806523.1 nucleotidyltransferase family protein [Porticoccus sp.]